MVQCGYSHQREKKHFYTYGNGFGSFSDHFHWENQANENGFLELIIRTKMVFLELTLFAYSGDVKCFARAPVRAQAKEVSNTTNY